MTRNPLAGWWRLAVWLGLATGLAEVAVHALRRYWRHRMVVLGDATIWMAPLAEVALFLLAGLLVAQVWKARGRDPTRGVLGFLLFLGALEVLLAYPGLHRLASLALAAGIGIQGGRWLGSRMMPVERVVRRTLPALAAVVVVAGLAVHGARAFLEVRATRALAGPGGPNILLVILDTVRGLDFEGRDVLESWMPGLGRQAGRGIRFDFALAPSSWTLPSHASFFTGRWPHEHRATWGTPLDGRYPTLAEALQSRGYLTAGFVANKVYTTRQSGLDRGFIRYEDFVVGPGEFMRSSSLLRILVENADVRRLIPWREAAGRKNAARINRDVLGWLERRPARPFFAFVNYFDAHAPWVPPPPFNRLLDSLQDAGIAGDGFFGITKFVTPAPDVLAAMRASYEGMVRYLDREVTGLLDSLGRSGLLDSTIVIVTSDHGEEFGEHGIISHGNGLYRVQVQVPFFVLLPGQAPRRIVEPVSLQNLAATIAELAGLPEGAFPGQSLAGVLRGGPVPASRGASVLLEANLPPPRPDLVSVLSDSVRLVRSSAGDEALFGRGDPMEARNLRSTAAGASLAERAARVADSVLAAPARAGP